MTRHRTGSDALRWNLLIVILALAVIGLTRDAGHADPARLGARYPTKRVYITFSALSAIQNLMRDPSSYASLRKAHNGVAIDLLKSFLDQHVTLNIRSSAAFLMVDFGSNSAFYKMDNNTGIAERLDPRWDGQILEIASVIDELLDQQKYAVDTQIKIRNGELALVPAFNEFKKIKADLLIPVQFKAQVAYTVKLKYETDLTAQKEFRALDDSSKVEMAALLFDLSKSEIIEAGKPGATAAAVKAFDAKLSHIAPDQ